MDGRGAARRWRGVVRGGTVKLGLFEGWGFGEIWVRGAGGRGGGRGPG